MKPLLVLQVTVISVFVKTNTFHDQDVIPVPYLLGGSSPVRWQFPYLVSLQVNGSHDCGGAIISPAWVISAAHCFDTPKKLVAVAGLLVLDENHEDNQKIPAQRVIKHPKFKKNVYDISLINLQWEFTFTRAVHPIQLPRYREKFSGEVTVSGWGGIAVLGYAHEVKNALVYPNTLQYLDTQLISIEECNNQLQRIGRYPMRVKKNFHLCTVANGAGMSSCHADSGSPLAQGNVLVGIVHGGDIDCGHGINVPSPNVYTALSSFLRFVVHFVDDLPVQPTIYYK